MLWVWPTAVPNWTCYRMRFRRMPSGPVPPAWPVLKSVRSAMNPCRTFFRFAESWSLMLKCRMNLRMPCGVWMNRGIPSESQHESGRDGPKILISRSRMQPKNLRNISGTSVTLHPSTRIVSKPPVKWLRCLMRPVLISELS